MPLLHPATVDLSLPAWQELLPVAAAPAEAPAPWVSARDVTLRGPAAAPTWQARWQVEAPVAGPITLRLADHDVLDVTVDGRPVSTRRVGGGVEVTLWGPGTHAVVARGDLHGDALRLLPGAAGRVRVDVDGVTLLADDRRVPLVDGVAVTGAAALRLAPAAPTAPPRDVLVSAARVGVTVTDGSVAVIGALTVSARRGAVREVELSAAGFGDAPSLHAPPGAVVTPVTGGWRVQLSPRADARLIVRGSHARPPDDRFAVPAPTLRARGVASVDQALFIARDADDEVLLALQGGRVARAPDTTGLVEGALVEARHGEVTGEIVVAAFRPAPGPPLLIDVADVVVAVTPEGRTLTQVTWTVRNERAAALDVTLPPGATLLAARVDGAASPASVRGDAVRVALPRSVETAQGSLAFPVELTVLGAGAQAWRPGARVAVQVPAPDAPIAVRRLTVDLPRGWRCADEVRGAVEAFSEGGGLAYGFGVGGEAQAQEQLYRSAVAAWMENDFEAAQQALDDLRAQGADNVNVTRLQSNLDVVADAENAVTVEAKKVLELARARALEDVARQDALLQEAERAVAVGDEKAALLAYEHAAALDRRFQGALAREEEKSEAQEALRRLAPRAKDAGPLAGENEPSPSPALAGGVSGELAGAALDADAPAAEPLSADLLLNLPTPSGYTQAFDAVSELRGAGRATSDGAERAPAKPDADAAPPPPPAPPGRGGGVATVSRSASGRGAVAPPTVALPAPPPTEVSAVAAALVVPVTGEVLRVQTLLVPAGDLSPVHLTVRPTRR